MSKIRLKDRWYEIEMTYPYQEPPLEVYMPNGRLEYQRRDSVNVCLETEFLITQSPCLIEYKEKIYAFYASSQLDRELKTLVLGNLKLLPTPDAVEDWIKKNLVE